MEQLNKKIFPNRRSVVGKLLKERQDMLIVTGLGSSTYDVYAAGDHNNNFYLWGAMGSAATVGLGLANSQPTRKVLVITGDGEMLMGIGALATIAVQRPTNLTIVVLDNGHYGETGMQQSHAGKGIQLDRIAHACEFDYSVQLTTLEEIESLRQHIHSNESLNFAVIKISTENPPRTMPSRDGVHIKNRFRISLGFPPN